MTVQQKDSIIARTGSIAAASFVQNAVAFAATIYVSRLLGPEGRGVYYLPILTATTVLAFCKLGVDQTNVYLLGTRRIPMRSLSRQNTALALCAGGLGLAVTVILPFVTPSMYRTTTVAALFVAGLLIPVGLHTQFTAGLLSLAGQPALQYRAGVVGAIAQIVVLALLTMRGSLTPGTAVAAAVSGAAVTWALLSIRLSQITSVLPAVDLRLLRETLGTSIPLHAASLLLLLHLRVDMFMVSSWRGARALGLYSLAVALGETVMLVTESVALAILPEQVTGSVQDAARRSLEGARAMVIIGLLLCVGWVLAGRVLIRVAFGDDYLPAYGPLVALLPGILMLGLQRMCSAPALRAGRPSWFVAISGVSLACNAALNAVWIPQWGLYGASFASTLSYTLSSLAFLVWTARSAGEPLAVIIPEAADWRLLRMLPASLLYRVRRQRRPDRPHVS
jgi:O-antigen/teichoic acid export membrane protein